MVHQNTKTYVHILPDIIKSYNHTQLKRLGGKHTPNQIHKLTDHKKNSTTIQQNI